MHRGPAGMGQGAQDWILSIRLADGARLMVMLGDGQWQCELGDAPWPPTCGPALPAVIAARLATLGEARLRLQLPRGLDAWSWEREIADAAGAVGVVPRFLTDLPPRDAADDADAAAGAPPPLLTMAPAGELPLSLLQSARRLGRPLLVVDAALGAPAARTLEVFVRKHWRGPLALSEALQAALVELSLPVASCRLYGDGLAATVDDEQGRRPVTAVSIDLVRSTPLLQAGDEDYARRLQAYYKLCRDVIEKLDGYVDPPIGNDGLMSYFGFPLAVEDAASRGLTAAWQVSRRVRELGLMVRIGVASGNVAVSERQAFGSDVHLAARLRELAQPGEVLVAASTRARAGAGYQWSEQVGRPAPKDYPHETSIYRLDGPCAGQPSQRGVAAGPFVGRESEFEHLRRAWEDACRGRPRWCAVQGEPGIGKSRLLDEFSRQLRAGGGACVEFTGTAPSAHSPFAALIDGLRLHEGLDAGLDTDALACRMVERLGTAAQAPVDTAGGGQPPWRDLLLGWLQALSARGPLCLLVDDAHWLDPSSIDLLRRLRELCAERPLLVVSGERSEAARAAVLAGAEPIELHGLQPEAAAVLAAALAASLPERVRRRIVERAEGVPLYLEEESLRLLSQPDAETSGAVPATLEDLLMVRLDALGADRTLAQLMSVLGRDCSDGLLQTLLEQDDPFVAQARRQGSLASLTASGVVQATVGPPSGYRFRHALIRDAAYGSIWAHDRRRLHGLCADLIERHLPDLARQRPEQIAQHLEAAGRSAAARRAWQTATQLAASRAAHAETLELAERALALDAAEPVEADSSRATMQMHLLIASAQIALRGYGSAEVEAAYQAAERASSRLASRGPALRIRLGLEACYVMRGDLSRAEELARGAVAATQWSDEPRLALQARWALANVQFHRGDWRASLDGFDECLSRYRTDLHRRSGVQDPAVMCLGYSSWIHFELGQADEALDRIERMLALAQQLDHPFSSAVAHGFAASVKRLCGDSANAWPHAVEAVRLGQQGDFQVWLAHAYMARGQLRADRGDVAGGDEDMQRGYDRWVGSGARISCATYLSTRAEILLRQGRNAEAAACLDDAWQVSSAIGEHYYRAEQLRLQGVCAWQAGERRRAGETLQRALALAHEDGRPGLALRCALSLGALDPSGGGFEAASARLKSLVTALPRHGRSRDLRWARQALDRWDRGQCFDAADATPWEPT